MSATGYSSSWLVERFEIDGKSRDKNLTSQFVKKLPDKDILKLVDLGSGMGSNALYFLDKIQSDIQWYLIEVDENLIKAGTIHLSNVCKEEGLEVSTIPNGLRIQNQHTLHIHYVRSSIFDIKNTQWLAFDGILGNALLDVFSKEELNQLIEGLTITTAPKLFSIIYQDMHWGDSDSWNDFFVSSYHEHMQREQKGKRALGPGIIDYLTSWFSEQNVAFKTASSNWELSPDDNALLAHLLRFYENSIPEILRKTSDVEKFEAWLTNKKIGIHNAGLSAIVNHIDFLF